MLASILELILPSTQIERYKEEIDCAGLEQMRQKAIKRLAAEHWRPTITCLNGIMELFGQAATLGYDAGLVQIQAAKLIEEPLASQLQHIIKGLVPWRIGPYQIGQQVIDSEWQSNVKFSRLEKLLSHNSESIKGKRVLDLGCNNGYFSWRLLQLKPRIVFSFDPLERALLQLLFIKGLLADQVVVPALASHQDLKYFPSFFDSVLCLGVLYHRRDPFLFLRDVHNSLRHTGHLVLETLVIPGEDNQVFSVPQRYCGMHNIYLVPTVTALKVWLSRNGFSSIEVIDVSPLSKSEQRATAFAPFHSLKDFLDQNNEELSVEGYPAPLRVCISARAFKN